MSEEIQAPKLARYYPAQAVAEHEVLLVFVNDLDAEDFHEWWLVAGLAAYRRDVEAARRLR